MSFLVTSLELFLNCSLALKIAGQLCCPLIYALLVFPHDYIHVMYLQQEYHRSDVFFSLYLIRWYIASICPITDGVSFDHCVKVVSASVLYLNVAIFTFVINQIL